MIDLAKSTIEELQVEFVRLAGILVDVENQRQVLDDEIQNRRRVVIAKSRVDAMDEAEKDAMRDVLKMPAAEAAAEVKP